MAISPPNSASHDRKRRRDAVTTASRAHEMLIPKRSKHCLVKRRRIELRTDIVTTSRVAHPPRPKRAFTFDIPTHVLSLANSTTSGIDSPARASKKEDGRSRSSTPMQSAGNDRIVHPLLSLSRINVLMTGINRRNKNQHRNQPFFKYFSILRRCINKLIDLHEQSIKLAETTPANADNLHSASSTRQRFEKEFHLRSQREILESQIRERIVPAAYVTFSGLIADTQFANLGVVLVGLLTDVVGVVGEIRTVEQRGQLRTKAKPSQSTETSMEWLSGRLVGTSTLMTGPDQGTVVERIYDSDHGVISEVEVGAGNDILKSATKTVDVDLGEVVQRKEIIEQPNEGLSGSTKKEQKAINAQQMRGDARLGKAEETQEKERVTMMDIEASGAMTPIPQHKQNTILTSSESYDLVDALDEPPKSLIEDSFNHPPSDSKVYSIAAIQAEHLPQARVTIANKKTTCLEPRTDPHLTISPPKRPISSTIPPPNPASIKEGDPPTSKAANHKNDKDKDEIKKKKKKKRKNAIDDLFSGFG